MHELQAQSPDAIAIVGLAAAYLALGETYIAPERQVEISVSQNHFRYLQSREDWNQDPTDKKWLKSSTIRASVGPGYHTSHEELLGRTWMHGPFHVAGLPDVYARDQHESELNDTELARAIRKRLYDPEQPPLAKPILAKTIQDIELLLASQPDLAGVPDFERSVWLAADAIYGEETILGDKEVGRANRIYGSLENGRPHAYYHNAMDVLHDGALALEHGKRAGLSPLYRLLGFVATVAADRQYGNGRKSDNPHTYDEKVSALLTYQRAHILGLQSESAQLIKSGILNTAFDEETKRQPGQYHPHPVVRIPTGADLQLVSMPEGPLAALALFFEDLMSRRYAGDNAILADLYEHHVHAHGFLDVGTLERMCLFANTQLDIRLTKGQMTLREAGVKHLLGNADFQGKTAAHSHRFPDGWTLEDESIRHRNGETLTQAAKDLERGASLSDVHQMMSRKLTSSKE